LGYRRSRGDQFPNTSLLRLEGVHDRRATDFYLGKHVAYLYRAKTKKWGTKVRVVWGKVTRPHGNNGVVRAKFQRNLAPKTMGATARVMLYPSRV